MRLVPFGYATRIAVIVLMLQAGRAFAGFTDTAQASVPSPSLLLNDDEFANADESAPALTFDTPAKETKGGEKTVAPKNLQAEIQSPQPVAAPLPVALLPGGVMLAGTFLATRVLKRRIA